MRIENPRDFLVRVGATAAFSALTYWGSEVPLYPESDPNYQSYIQNKQAKQELAVEMSRDGLFAQTGLFAVERRFLSDPRHDQYDTLSKREDDLAKSLRDEHPLRSNLLGIKPLSVIVGAVGLALNGTAALTHISWRRRDPVPAVN